MDSEELKPHCMTKTFKLKAVDFVRMSKGAMSYVFAGAFKDNQKQTFDSFNETLRLCLTTHFNADGQPLTASVKRCAAALMEQVTETMSLIEMCCPAIFFDNIMHELLHVPMAMARWNSCRNFWAFPSER